MPSNTIHTEIGEVDILDTTSSQILHLHVHSTCYTQAAILQWTYQTWPEHPRRLVPDTEEGYWFLIITPSERISNEHSENPSCA